MNHLSKLFVYFVFLVAPSAIYAQDVTAPVTWDISSPVDGIASPSSWFGLKNVTWYGNPKPYAGNDLVVSTTSAKFPGFTFLGIRPYNHMSITNEAIANELMIRFKTLPLQK